MFMLTAAILLDLLSLRPAHFKSFLLPSLSSMAQSQEFSKAEGVAPSAEVEISDLIDFIDVDAGAEGDSPSAVGVAPAEQRGQLRPHPKTEASEDGVGEPAHKSVRIKTESDDAGGPPVAEAFVSPAKVRPPKRGRSFGGLGVSPGAKSSTGADDAPAECEGCGRSRGVSPDFLIVGESCVWAYADGKGAWCRECHTCHRTNFQHEQGLVFLLIGCG